MKIQGGKGERGAKGCQISPKERDGDIISNVGKYRREGVVHRRKFVLGVHWVK